MHEIITSAANPIAKRMRQLADRKHRRREGAFVVDGIQPVTRAIEFGADIDTLLVAPDLLRNRAAADLVEDQERSGVRVARLSGELFTRLSERDGPGGLAAIVRAAPLPLDQLPVAPGSVFVALHEVGNPGNLGTIIRTADATGAGGVIMIGDSSDPYAPTAVKASMGSLFAVAVARVPDLDAFFGWATVNRVQTVATSGSADDPHWNAPYQAPLAILLGSEGPGLPDGAITRASLRVRIPMTGSAESLNLAVAAGVMLYQVRADALRHA